MKRIYDRCQQTIARPVDVHGTGYITGRQVRVRFRPAPASTGIVFVRADLGMQACVPAAVDNVTGTQRRTTLGRAPVQISLVEHVLAALYGMRIDNCFVDVDAPEPPGMDGSARGFVQALRQAGSVVSHQRKTVWTVTEPIVFAANDATIALHPAAGQELRVSYLLDYGAASSIGWQMATLAIDPGTFTEQVAPSRTFLTEEEAIAFRSQGLGSRTAVSDLLVFGPHGPIGNKLRFANEPARHKILDILGDLSLLGCDLRGHVVAYRSGHPHNIGLANLLSHQLPACRGGARRAA